MKLTISYATKEREYISKNTYYNKTKLVELEAIAIKRVPVGSTGAARNRYHYHANFVAPDDAEFTYNGILSANIIRKINKEFKPHLLVFLNNTCLLKEQP